MLSGTWCDIWGWSCAGPEVGLKDPCESLPTQHVLWLCMRVCALWNLNESVTLMNPDFLVQINWLPNILAITHNIKNSATINLQPYGWDTYFKWTKWNIVFWSFLNFNDNCKWVSTPNWGYSFTFFLLESFLFSYLLIWGAEVWGKAMNFHELILLLAK